MDPHDDADRPRAQSPRGIIDSLRALLDTVLSILHNRSELFTTEMEEEVSRLVRVLVWAIAAVFAVVIGATFLGAMVLLAAPPAYRVWTAAGLGALFLAFAALGLRAIRRIAREKPRPFDASVGELQKDLNHLRSAR